MLSIMPPHPTSPSPRPNKITGKKNDILAGRTHSTRTKNSPTTPKGTSYASVAANESDTQKAMAALTAKLEELQKKVDHLSSNTSQPTTNDQSDRLITLENKVSNLTNAITKGETTTYQWKYKMTERQTQIDNMVGSLATQMKLLAELSSKMMEKIEEKINNLQVNP
eukprot:Pgem_evm1s17087